LADLSGEAWVAVYISVTLGRLQAAIAREKLEAGEFREALTAIKADQPQADHLDAERRRGRA